MPPPETSEVEWDARSVARRLRRLLSLRGLGPHADPVLADPLPAGEPLLATLYGASVRSRIALGKRAGQRVLRFGDGGEAEAIEEPPHPRCVTAEGSSVHAQVGVPARDRRPRGWATIGIPQAPPPCLCSRHPCI